MSRRALLSKAGAATVAAVAAGMLLDPREAKATHLNDPIQVDSVLTHWVSATAENSDSAVKAYTTSDTNFTVDTLNTGKSPAVKGARRPFDDNHPPGVGLGTEFSAPTRAISRVKHLFFPTFPEGQALLLKEIATL